MNSWADVADDGIKIGLGAAIALIGVVISNVYEHRIFFRNRRADAIQKCAAEFSATMQVFVRLHAVYRTYRTIAADPNLRPLLQQKWEQIERILGDEVSPAFLAIQRYEAALSVVGANSSADRMAEFRSAAADLQSAAVAVHISDQTPTDVAEFVRLFQVAFDTSKRVTSALHKDYKQS